MERAPGEDILRAKALARLIGPVIIVLTLSEIWNARIWSGNTAINIYQNGTLLFIAGIAIVHNHNSWIMRWTTIITLVGWISMSLGIYRMFFPVCQQSLITEHHDFIYVLPVATLLLAIGGYLTKAGYQNRR